MPATATAIWLTETRYKRHTFRIDSQLEVTVKDADTLVTKIKHVGLCSARDASAGTAGEFNVSCYQREFLYQRKCYSSEFDNKYIVEHNDGISIHFLCMKFVARNQNVVQVWLGPRRHSPDYDICTNQWLQLDPWPWIAAIRSEWHFCPLVGGFDLILQNMTSSKQCLNEMKSNRLESECINSEGLHITLSVPASCSPLPEQALELKLECWASWVDDFQLYIIMSQTNKHPQFVLRLAQSATEGGMEDSPVELFTSPICQTTQSSKFTAEFASTDADDDIGLIAMSLTSAESGLCYDESPYCRQLTQNERCTKSSMYQYANVCKKSCGICNLLPSPRPECRFSSDLLGEWLLAEVDGLRTVTITTGFITISGVGHFVCKGKHWNVNYYKLLSYYANGCRPRYSCIRLERAADDTLRLLLSQSSMTDKSFDVCRFSDDVMPLGSRIHSALPKILIPTSRVHFGSCGLNGTVDVSAHFSSVDETLSCRGRLSDWSSAQCRSQPRIQLNVDSQCAINALINMSKQQLKCLASVTMSDGFSVIWTQLSYLDPAGKTAVATASEGPISCWVISLREESMASVNNVWSELHQLNRAQCGFELDLDTVYLRSIAKLSLTVANASDRHNIRRHCVIRQSTATATAVLEDGRLGPLIPTTSSNKMTTTSQTSPAGRHWSKTSNVQQNSVGTLKYYYNTRSAAYRPTPSVSSVCHCMTRAFLISVIPLYAYHLAVFLPYFTPTLM